MQLIEISHNTWYDTRVSTHSVRPAALWIPMCAFARFRSVAVLEAIVMSQTKCRLIIFTSKRSALLRVNKARCESEAHAK